MKNLKLQIVLLFIFSTLSFSQVATDSVKIPFVSYWSKGDVYKFKVKKTDEKWNNDKIIKSDSIIYNATFTVLDSTETSYKIKWSYKMDISKSLKLPKSFVTAISKFEEMDVIYTTSEVGDFIGVENWEELSLKMKEMTNELIKIFPEKDKSNTDLKKTLQQIFDVFSTKEGIELYLTKDIQLFHYPFGVEFNTEEDFIYEEKLANPFGGKPLRAESVVHFENVDVKNNRCVFIREMTINLEDSKEMVNHILKKMLPKDKKIEDFAKNSKFEINDFNTYDYLFNPGIPVYISNEREILINMDNKNEKKIERLEIELID